MNPRDEEIFYPDDRGPEPRSPLWSSLLHLFRGIISGLHDVKNLSPEQVASLSPDAIKQLALQVNHLNPEGVRKWNTEQFKSLTTSQLTHLNHDWIPWVTAALPPDHIVKWLDELSRSRSDLLAQTKHILTGIGEDESKLAVYGQALDRHKDEALAREALWTATRDMTEFQFRRIMDEIAPERLHQILWGSSKDEIVQRRLDQEFEQYKGMRSNYESMGDQFDNIIRELNKYERRLLLARHNSIRRRIYDEMTEWFNELPIKQLLVGIGIDDTLFQQDQDDWYDAVNQFFNQLQEMVQNERIAFSESNDLLWTDLPGLKNAWNKTRLDLSRSMKIVEEACSELESLEKSLVPQLSFLETVDHRLSEKETKEVGEHLSEVAKQLDVVQKQRAKLVRLAQTASMIKMGLDNAIDQERFHAYEHLDEGGGSEVVWSLPIILFKRFVSLQEPGVYAAHLEKIAHHVSLLRFRESCSLYAEVTREESKVQHLIEETSLSHDGVVPRSLDLLSKMYHLAA